MEQGIPQPSHHKHLGNGGAHGKRILQRTQGGYRVVTPNVLTITSHFGFCTCLMSFCFQVNGIEAKCSADCIHQLAVHLVVVGLTTGLSGGGSPATFYIIFLHTAPLNQGRPHGMRSAQTALWW